MNQNQNQNNLKRKKTDWLGIIAIILILVAMFFLYKEQKACSDFNIIDFKKIAEENSYVVINIYKNKSDLFPTETLSFDLKEKLIDISSIK